MTARQLVVTTKAPKWFVPPNLAINPPPALAVLAAIAPTLRPTPALRLAELRPVWAPDALTTAVPLKPAA